MLSVSCFVCVVRAVGSEMVSMMVRRSQLRRSSFLAAEVVGQSGFPGAYLPLHFRPQPRPLLGDSPLDQTAELGRDDRLLHLPLLLVFPYPAQTLMKNYVLKVTSLCSGWWVMPWRYWSLFETVRHLYSCQTPIRGSYRFQRCPWTPDPVS